MSKKRNNKILIIIPVYNEEKSIAGVIRDIKRVRANFDIIVIDDGSTDKTRDVVKRESIKVISLVTNCGSGAALKKGYLFALQKNYTFVIQVDGDGQHDPAYIPHLLREEAKSGVDMIIGSRFIRETKYHTPVLRLACIRILSWLIDIFFDKEIKDPTSGYRLLNRRLMKFLITCYTNRCPEALSISKVLRAGFTIREVSVEMRQRRAGKSKLTLIKGFGCFVKSATTIAFQGVTR